MTTTPASWAALLHDLRRLNPDIDAAVLLAADGAILSMAAEPALADALAPSLALLSSVAARATTELGRGALETIVASGTQGLLVGRDLGDGRILAVLAGSSGALGLLLDDVRVCAERCRVTNDFGDSALEAS